MKNIFQLLSFLFCLSAKGQQQFQLLYHPFSSQQAACMKHAVGGGYLLASNISSGMLLTRFDEQFAILWNKTIDSNSVSDFYQNSFGNIFIICPGTTIIKTDSTLNVIWKTTISPGSYEDLHIIETTIGNIFVAGTARDNSFTQQMFVSCTDSSGTLLWCKVLTNDTIHGSYSYVSDLVSSLNGNGKVLIGLTFGDIYDTKGSIFEIDSSGNISIVLSSGGSVLDGITYNSSNGYAFFGIDLDGNIENSISLVNINGQPYNVMHYNYTGEMFNNIKTSDGGFAIAISMFISFNHYKTTILKVDGNLIPQWCRAYNTFDSLNISSVLQTNDNGYILTGTLGTDVVLIKTDSSGFSSCNDSTINVSNNTVTDNYFSFLGLNTEPVILNSLTLEVSSSVSYTYLDTLCYSITAVENPAFQLVFTIYPNPASSQFVIGSMQYAIKEIEIFNLVGEKIYSDESSHETFSVNCDSWPEGIYFVVAADENGNKITEMISVIR